MDVLYGLAKDFVFKEAVAFLKGKKALTSEEYRLLDDESRAKAFTVSGYTSLGVLQEFLDCLTKAAEEGTTKEQFREDMNRFLEEHGYEGINPWKSDNIFRTNMQTALNAGHYKSMTDETTMKMRPYWRYRTAGDGHVRESHAVMEGRVYRADDPIWDICVKRRITARQNSKLNPIIYSRFLHITAKFSAASSHYSRELSVQL